MTAHSLRRRLSHRPPKRRILVACDGEQTEPNYFRGLRRLQEVHDRFVLIIVPGKGKTPRETVEGAIRRFHQEKRRGKEFQYDDVWCILDVEEEGRNATLNEARHLARKEHFYVALSNPAFEVWLLAHFERTARSFLNCDQVIRQLDRHWQQRFAAGYEKSDSRIFDRLGERRADAVRNAKSVREEHFRQVVDSVQCNSSTEVYRLVELLLNRPD